MGRDLALAIIFAVAVGILLHLYHVPRSPGDRIPGEARVLHESVIPGGYIAPAPRVVDGNPAAPHDSRKIVLIIYNHGSIAEQAAEACDPQRNPPPVLKDLAGKTVSGMTVAVFSYCSHLKVGGWASQDARRSDMRVERRAKDIEDLVRSFLEFGVPPEQIFLSGQSEGAWASLVAARRQVVPFNGVIAFAPAFAGRTAERSQNGWRVQRRQVAAFGGLQRLDALVFAFEGDSFNRIEDLDFLEGIDGVDFVPLSGVSIEGIECREREPHFIAYRNCFRRTQKPVIVEFLRRRLWQTHATD